MRMMKQNLMRALHVAIKSESEVGKSLYGEDFESMEIAAWKIHLKELFDDKNIQLIQLEGDGYER